MLVSLTVNQVAHELVKLARFSPPGVWMESPPAGVASFIVNDNILLTDE